MVLSRVGERQSPICKTLEKPILGGLGSCETSDSRKISKINNNLCPSKNLHKHCKSQEKIKTMLMQKDRAPSKCQRAPKAIQKRFYGHKA